MFEFFVLRARNSMCADEQAGFSPEFRYGHDSREAVLEILRQKSAAS